MIAALYVETNGVYFGLPDVDPWDVTRDAKKYAGPWPVVAHPPCGAWANLRHLYRGDDADCALRAVDQVRSFGGVLEHPARSRLWYTGSVREAMLPWPGRADCFGGYTLEVEQVSWGHVARKRTWLYFVGVDRDLVARTVRTGGAPTHWVSGGRSCKSGGSVPPGIKVCSAQQRRRTPLAFRDWLLDLARSVERRAA